MTKVAGTGVVFCVLTIFLGALALESKGRLVGVLVMLSSAAAAMLSSGYVALLMVLACVGGLLVSLAKPVREITATNGSGSRSA